VRRGGGGGVSSALSGDGEIFVQQPARQSSGRAARQPAPPSHNTPASSRKTPSSYSQSLLAALGDEHVDLVLKLPQPFDLNVELFVDVVEVRHHHVEHVVFVERAG
jgi:hypothetical protein